MKSLLLLRHAQSADKQIGQHDLDRVLTADGKAQASRVGEYLKKKNLLPDVIVCSHAVRASSTAAIVADKADYDVDKIVEVEAFYEASLNSLLSSIKVIEDRFVSILLVGHNPSISILGEFLTDEHIGNVNTAGLLFIEFNFSSWKEITRGAGKLVPVTID